jgi:hypothetical protein
MPTEFLVDFLFVPVKLSVIDIHSPVGLSILSTPVPSTVSTSVKSQSRKRTSDDFISRVTSSGEPKFPFFRKSAILFAAADALLLVGLISGFGSPLDFSLLRWTAGAVVLGTPASLAIDHLAKSRNFRLAFLFEAGLTIFAFAWLCGGFVVLGNSPAVDAAPLLWWPAFTESVLGMSVMGTSCFCLISTSVLSLMLSGDAPNPVDSRPTS